jgi:hypothetical protein
MELLFGYLEKGARNIEPHARQWGGWQIANLD